jgi:hypothetical protein
MRPSFLSLIAVLLLVSGCGSSSKTAATSSPSGSAGGTLASEGGGALAADAKSAATGDVPDTQNFLTWSAARLRVSMVYPEGWAIRETASGASITDKNNLVRVTLARGAAPTVASAQATLATLTHSTPGLTARPPQAISLKSGPAVKATYTTRSAPNPVTGKQVTLTVDRYVLGHAGRVAIVDLGTPIGVDNVDAYKRMIESFQWR